MIKNPGNNYQAYIWTQERATVQDYKLIQNNETFAHLDFKGFMKTGAVVEAHDSAWILSQKGLFSRSYNIHDKATEMEKGIIRQFTFRADEIEIFGQGIYSIHHLNFWRTVWEIRDNMNRSIVVFKPYGRGWRDIFRTQAEINFKVNMEDIPDIFLIVSAAWFNKIQRQRQAAAAAAGS